MKIVPLEMFGYDAPAQVHPHQPRLEVVCMADVRPSAIDWLWQNWIALGKVHVLAGEGGRGKSTILCNTTAITTTGTKWPDGAEARKPAGVIILAAEDDVEDTLAPRLMAAGADRLAFLSSARSLTKIGGAGSAFRLTLNGLRRRS